ncbi:MAG TPA: flagellar motor switch protein FliN [Solirubrobacteraceae bacterium]|nr:flagellar motor switch protein FliN [Solirubrobacteraceae bacterium]
MAQEIEYEQLDASASQEQGESEVDLRRISGIPMELSVEIGRTQMTVGETLALRPGSIVTLQRFAGEPVDLLVNGTPIATGEVVVVDDKFGLRISTIVQDGEIEQESAVEDASGDPSTGEHVEG